MSDISAKVLQDIPLKQRGHEVPTPPSEALAPDPAEKTVQPSAESNPYGKQSGGQNDQGQGQHHTYTVIIANRAGETRAISLNAGSPGEAKSAASSGLDQGEQVTSVSESTVQQPDPDRGLVA